ncbi:hypothetical protein NKH77_30640 [Streptomyces sp. M19]
MTVALLALAAIPPFSGFFSRRPSSARPSTPPPGTRTASRSPRAGPSSSPVWSPPSSPRATPPASGSWPSTAPARRPRPRPPARRDERRAVGAVHPQRRLRPDRRRPAGLVRRPLARPDPHHLRPGHRLRPHRPALHLRHVAVHHRCRRPPPLGAVAAHPDGSPALSEAVAIATHEPAYGDIAAAPDPADPGRLLLGPLHRHAAAGFHLDAVYAALFVRPVRAAARLVRFLDREVVDGYVSGAAGAPACSAPPSAGPRPATCRPISARCSRVPSSWSSPSSSQREPDP